MGDGSQFSAKGLSLRKQAQDRYDVAKRHQTDTGGLACQLGMTLQSPAKGRRCDDCARTMPDKQHFIGVAVLNDVGQVLRKLVQASFQIRRGTARLSGSEGIEACQPKAVAEAFNQATALG